MGYNINLYEHRYIKKYMRKFGLVSPNDYIRSVGTHGWTDISINRINNIVNDNSKMIYIFKPAVDEEPQILLVENLYDLYMDINERFIKRKISSAYDEKRNRLIGHFIDEATLRIGNKSSEYINLVFEQADINNLTKKNKYTTDLSHSGLQGQLISLGLSLGYEVKVARNDISLKFDNGLEFKDIATLEITDLNLENLNIKASKDKIDLIDVIWFDKKRKQIVAVIEIELSGRFDECLLKFNELYHHCRNRNRIYYIILGKNSAYKLVGKHSKLNTYSNISNKLYFLTIDNLIDMLVFKDELGFGNHKDIQQNVFFKKKLIPITNTNIYLPI